MTEGVRISAVVPCFNSGKFLERALGSLLGQTYPLLEIICVDDGSTDNTGEILRGFAERHAESIRLIRQENRGASAARNRGLREAGGDFIQFLDADDFLEKEKIAHQVALINKTPLSFIAGSYKKTYLHGGEETYSVHADSWTGLATGRLGSTCSNLWNKDILLAAGGWDESLKSSQEAELMFRMLKKFPGALPDNTPLTKVYQQKTSISLSGIADNRKRFVELRFDIWDYLKENQLLTPERIEPIGQMIFDSIRALHAYHPRLARELHENRFKPMGFNPGCSAATSRKYLLVYRMLGFKLAELFAGIKKGV